jgi:hypothetical protein
MLENSIFSIFLALNIISFFKAFKKSDLCFKTAIEQKSQYAHLLLQKGICKYMPDI